MFKRTCMPQFPVVKIGSPGSAFHGPGKQSSDKVSLNRAQQTRDQLLGSNLVVDGGYA